MPIHKLHEIAVIDMPHASFWARWLLSMLMAIIAALCLDVFLATDSSLAQGATLGTGGATGEDVARAIGIRGATNIGEGKPFNLGLVVSLTGPDVSFGLKRANGARLAAAQIKAAGGPDIDLIIKDDRSGNEVAAASALSQLSAAGIPAALISEVGNAEALLSGGYKILTLDTDGTADQGRGEPYFWGMRATQPDDDFAGALQYWVETDPKIRRVSLVYGDQGPTDAEVTANFKRALADAGLELASVELTTKGMRDHSAAIADLRAAAPDAVFFSGTGVEPGYFMKQFVAAGLGAHVIGSSYSTQAAAVAGPAFDGYVFATDWFDPQRPTNDWAALFVASYQKQFGTLPEIEAANAYEDTFAVWTLIRRVLAKGGDISSAEVLQRELVANRAFKSLYGGDGNELDDILLDATTHSVIERPFGIFLCEGGDVRPVAAFDFGAANFKLLN